MYFVSPLLLAQSRQFSRRRRFPQQKQSSNFNDHTVMASVNKHHADAVNELQKVKRAYFQVRRPFL